MAFPSRIFMLAAVLAGLPLHAAADKTTVCTVTVNSADERETIRRNLPDDRFQFVELVERGRSDWLASACRAGVRCDVLVISGHFDGGDEFYSDRVDARESLPVDEMERVSCSDSCPGLFSQLREVYLFGCNTLNADSLDSVSGEVARSLVRAGHSQEDAAALARVLNERHAGSNRDRMRQIFKDVPVIYGFSSKAPLGATAGPMLERYLRAGGTAEIGSGRASSKLLGVFAPSSMTVAAGATDGDAQAPFRRDACRFVDDRLTAAQKLRFVHELLDRDMAEVRLFLDRIEKTIASLSVPDRLGASVAEALDAIVADRAARGRYLDFARDADQPAVRMRMIELAARIGWLTPVERHVEVLRMIDERLASRTVDVADVDLVCALNGNGEFDDAPAALQAKHAGSGAAHAAILACLGDGVARAQVLRALTSARDDDGSFAQVYLRHRPIADTGELRGVASAIARMGNRQAQVRALDTLAAHGVSDRESLAELTHVYASARSPDVQRAVAGVLIRADYRTLAKDDVVRTLTRHRLKAEEGKDLIDALIRRLQQASTDAAPTRSSGAREAAAHGGAA
jgi:hypothetical protein